MTADVVWLPIGSSSNTEVPEGLVAATELVNRSGASYRRIDYLTRTGRLHALPRPRKSGYLTLYPAEEIPVARLLTALVDDGVRDLDAAERIARDLAETGTACLAGMPLHLPVDL